MGRTVTKHRPGKACSVVLVLLGFVSLLATSCGHALDLQHWVTRAGRRVEPPQRPSEFENGALVTEPTSRDGSTGSGGIWKATAAGNGTVSFAMPGRGRPHLFVILKHVPVKAAQEAIAIQEHLRVYAAPARKNTGGKHRVKVHLLFSFTCVTPGAYRAEVFCEQEGSYTGRFPPPKTWIRDTALNTLRFPRYRPEEYARSEYTNGAPKVALVKVATTQVECVADPQRVAEVLHDLGRGGVGADDGWNNSTDSINSNNVFPRAGSWVRAEQHLPPLPQGVPWDVAWFERYLARNYHKVSYDKLRRSNPELFDDLRDPNHRSWVFEPHDLLRGAPIQPFYLPGTEGAQAAFLSALSQRRLFTFFMGDSVLNNVWEAFMAMAPQLMSNMKWDLHGQDAEEVVPARGVVGPQISSLMKWFHNISYDRYSNFTNFKLNAGGYDAAYLQVGMPPTHVVIGAGLWDAQSRPPSEYAKYIPILITSLRQMFGPRTHIIWLVMPPVDIAKKPGKHYRTNEFLLAASRIVKEQLGGAEGVTVVDGFTILSAMRSRSWDGIHYPAVWALDVANIIWNVVLST